MVGHPLAKAREALAGFGATMTEVKPPEMDPGLGLILAVESAAMFDQILLNGRLDLVKENG